MALPRLLPIACLITLLLIPQPLPAKELPLVFRRQHTSVWCWAAAVAMVVSHIQKFKVADCQVFSEYDVRRGGKGFCCIDPGSCTRAGGDDEMSDIMRTIFGIKSKLVERPISYEDIVREIDAGRPLIAAIDGTKTTGTSL